MKQKFFASVLAAVLTTTTLTCGSGLSAIAATGAGGYTWEKTEGYHSGTDTVSNKGDATVVTFTNADTEDNVAGFCTQSGEGWDWSDYTQLSFTLTNECETDISFALALGTGANWDWYQSTTEATLGAGESTQLTYYLQAEEWSFDGTVSALADLYAVHRINMMAMPAKAGETVSGGVMITNLQLTGSNAVEVEPKDGFYVNGNYLMDANRKNFKMRGTNYAYTWYSWDNLTEAAFAEIAGYGANTVRIVLGDGDQYTKNTAGEIKNLIDICKRNKLVAVFEVHDATGKDDKQALLNAAKYFANDIGSALKGHEDTVIINIANEWQGTANDTAWQSAYIEAVKIIRDAGLKHCIMCDAGGWGQSASTVINGGNAVLQADPEHNVMFSVHMYGTAGGKKSVIKNTMDSMIARDLCLVIGEFGYTHTDGDVDEAYIMEYAEKTKTGWLAWSWYGNGGGVEYLDMSSANAGGNLSKDWGEVVVNGDYGWQATSQPCSVFEGEIVITSSTVTTTTLPTETTTQTNTTTSYIISTPYMPYLYNTDIKLAVGETDSFYCKLFGFGTEVEMESVTPDVEGIVELELVGGYCYVTALQPGTVNVKVALPNNGYPFGGDTVTITVSEGETTTTSATSMTTVTTITTATTLIGTVEQNMVTLELGMTQTIPVGYSLKETFTAEKITMEDSNFDLDIKETDKTSSSYPNAKIYWIQVNQVGKTTLYFHTNKGIVAVDVFVAESYSPGYLCGDTDCDGEITVSDAVLVARIAVGDKEVKVSEQGMKNANVDKKGSITADDVTKLLQYLAKKISEL